VTVLSLASIGGPKTLWYATRGTGVVSLLLLTAIMCLGIAGVRRLRTERWPRFLVVGLHRNLALLAVAFVVLHVVTTVADGFAPIGLMDGVIPFASPYRPIWLGLGTVAFDLLLALVITSLLRARLGYRTWRGLHWAAYASWPIALVHSLGTGSDARIGWMQLLGAASVAVVVAAMLARLVDGSPWTGARSLAAAAVLLVPFGMLGWYVTGPGRAGWASRSGTPVRLLPQSAAAVVSSHSAKPAHSGAATLPAPPFTATLRGRMSSTQGSNGLVLVSIRGHTRRPAAGVLWIRLQGQAINGGGVSMTASGASFGPASLPEQYLGKIVALDGTRILLALHGRNGGMALHVSLRINGISHVVTGTVAAQAASG
jgi:DMSO/TMAO reductase YedYZ heme-binding membrane subunit